MNPGRALVLGSGVAGLTVARLLCHRGWRVDCSPDPQGRGPIVVISRPTMDLLLDLWQADETLFAGAHCLQSRVIHWERALPAAHLAAAAIVIPVDSLRERLVERSHAAGVRIIERKHVDPAQYDWIVRAGGRQAMSEGSIAFGRRGGVMATVKLTARARTDRTVMESVPGGWLYLIPQWLGRAVMQAVFAGETVEPNADLPRLLERSQVISPLVEEVLDDAAGFAAQPRLATTLCSLGSIAVGDAAMTLDPMSGNGIGNGLRSAILGAAVLEAADRDATSRACFDHFAQRLRNAMRSHVGTCIDFYGRAAHASDWRREIDAMSEALDRVPPGPDMPAFMLNNGRLDRVPQQGWG
jgi:flavin-dependent dehydrogenase